MGIIRKACAKALRKFNFVPIEKELTLVGDNNGDGVVDLNDNLPPESPSLPSFEPLHIGGGLAYALDVEGAGCFVRTINNDMIWAPGVKIERQSNGSYLVKIH